MNTMITMLLAKLCASFLLYGLVQSGEDGSKTKDCCLPDQFMAFVGAAGGFPADDIPWVYQAEKYLHYDLPNKRWAFKVIQFYDSGEYVEILWIQDYEKRTVTMARGDDECFYREIRTAQNMTQTCLPSDAKYMGTHKLGQGDVSLMYDSWKWDRVVEDWKNEDQHTTFQADIFHDTCMPFQTKGFFQVHKYTATPTHEWLNIELGVTEGDDSFFNEPAKYYDCEYKEDLRHNYFQTAEEVEFFDYYFRADTYTPKD